VLATFNRDKVRELKQLLASYDVEIIGLHDVRGAKVPPERGHSVQENAYEKARAAYDLTGLNAIADDTALEVDALGGKPGIYAARLAGPGATYTDNRNRLLEVLTGVAPELRTARFRTACVACLTSGRECVTEGVLEGRIAEHPHGDGGFGYDPIFELLDGRSLAELSAEEKNRISHRGIAMRELVKQLDLR
jgi:XTP/dITP diphosphohydrolase